LKMDVLEGEARVAEVAVMYDPRYHMSPEPPSPSWRRLQDMMKARAAGMEVEGCVVVTEEWDSEEGDE
jgi:hypothetical protein